VKSESVRVLLAGAAMMAIHGVAVAAGNEQIDVGKQEFDNKCAVCHGRSGRGDGGVIDLLKKAPADLTLYPRRMAASFPMTALPRR
jgi:mono/diheme cytochrome c family protein